jgi:Rad3-related DNA helicase
LTDEIPSPPELGLPAKYRTWRRFQTDAIRAIDEAQNPTVALLLPPGAGKSGIYIAWALWRKKRVMILTPNKFLQDQLYKDFSGIGLVDMRGQSNYTCAVSGGTVADAPCHGGFVCAEKPRCEYFAKLKRAPHERFLLSNPSFWFHNKNVLGEFDALIIDEAHRAFDTIADHVSITFKKKEVQTWFHRPPTRDWKAWASYQKTVFAGRLREMKDKFRKTDDDYDSIRIVKRLHDKVASLADADPKTLIYQQTMTGWTWDVVWPGAYRSLLTSHAKKFVFTSGTMTRRTLGMLGYTKDEYDWNEYPSTFPIARCPIHVLPAPRMNAATGASETRIWLEMMDRYMDSRKDRRGLIHSGSYQRAGFIATESRHASRMFVHTNSAGLPEAMERFLKSENGILVSPSIIEGTDFPYDAARFQIIGKLFFTDPRDPVAAERKRQDPQYPWYTAAMKVMQARGRVNRAADDFGETAICDGSWQDWFYKAAAHHFTAYFRAAIQVLHIVPDAAPIATNTLITGVSQKSQKVLDVPAPISAQYPSQPPVKKKAVPLFTENNPPILEKK